MPWKDNTMQLAAAAICASATHVQLHSDEAGVNGTDNLCDSARMPVPWAAPTGPGDFGLASRVKFSGGDPNSQVYSATFWSALSGGICRGEFLLDGSRTFNGRGNYTLSALDIGGVTGKMAIASTLQNVTSSLNVAMAPKATIAASLKRPTSSLTVANTIPAPTVAIASALKKATSALTVSMSGPSTGVASTMQKATSSITCSQTQTGPTVAIASTLKKSTSALTASSQKTAAIHSALKKATSALTARMLPTGVIHSTLKKAIFSSTSQQGAGLPSSLQLGFGLVQTQTTVTNVTARDVLRAHPMTQNQHIMGFGTLNPEPSPGVYDWTSLDDRMTFIASTNCTPIITLCAAPDWMKGGNPGQTNWNNIEVAPLPAHFADFAALSGTVAQRYPQVKHYQVWNEFKGFFNDALNRWDYEGYTTMYNLIYDTLKGIDPTINVGGPYASMDTNYNPSPILFGDWGAVDTRIMDAIVYWLANMHGADFFCCDGGPDFGTNEFSKLAYFSDIQAWIRTQTNLPLWWSEWGYGWDVGTPITAQHSLAVYAAGAVELALGGDTSLAWVEDLDTSAPSAYWNSDGTATPLLTQVQQFNTMFPPQISRRRITAPATVTGLMSALGRVVINKTNAPVTGTVEGQSVTLSAYEVRFVWTPNIRSTLKKPTSALVANEPYSNHLQSTLKKPTSALTATHPSTPAPVFANIGAYLNPGSTTAAAVPVPAGLVLNDVILAVFYSEIFQAITPPAGFSAATDSPIVVNVASEDFSANVFWKRQTSATGAGETTGTYAFSVAAGLATRCAVALRFTGCVTSGSPFDDTASAIQDTIAVPTTSPSVNIDATAGNRLLVWLCTSYHSATVIGMPSGFTQRANLASNGEFSVGTKVQVASGNSGAISGAITTTAGSLGVWLGALKGA